MPAEPLVGLTLVDSVALHEHALGLLDPRAARDLGLQLTNMVAERFELFEAGPRQRDHRLERFGGGAGGVRVQPALECLADHLRVVVVRSVSAAMTVSPISRSRATRLRRRSSTSSAATTR